jgi:hypothetical protein
LVDDDVFGDGHDFGDDLGGRGSWEGVSGG